MQFTSNDGNLCSRELAALTTEALGGYALRDVSMQVMIVDAALSYTYFYPSSVNSASETW